MKIKKEHSKIPFIKIDSFLSILFQLLEFLNFFSNLRVYFLMAKPCNIILVSRISKFFEYFVRFLHSSNNWGPTMSDDDKTDLLTRGLLAVNHVTSTALLVTVPAVITFGKMAP